MKRAFTIDEIKNSAVAHLNSHLFGERQKKVSKYGNQRVEIDGYKFDSKAEARYYVKLRMLKIAGEIIDLKVHPVFTLSVCKYEADFSYLDKDGSYHVIDVKGFKTKEYRLKKKLMKAELNIAITEIK